MLSMILSSWVRTLAGSNLVILPKLYLNQKVSSYDQRDILWEILEFNGQRTDVTHMKCLHLTFYVNSVPPIHDCIAHQNIRSG